MSGEYLDSRTVGMLFQISGRHVWVGFCMTMDGPIFLKRKDWDLLVDEISICTSGPVSIHAFRKNVTCFSNAKSITQYIEVGRFAVYIEVGGFADGEDGDGFGQDGVRTNECFHGACFFYYYCKGEILQEW